MNGTNITRRSAIATVAAGSFLPSGAAAFVAPAAPRDDLPEWFEEWKRRNYAFMGSGEGGCEAAGAAVLVAQERMLRTEAKTIAGAVAQLEFALMDGLAGNAYADGSDYNMIVNVIRFLKEVSA